MIAAAPVPVVTMQPTTYHRMKGDPESSYIQNKGRVVGKVKGYREVIFAARSCRKGKPYIIAKGRLRAGRWRTQVWFGLLPVKRGRVCFQVIKGDRALRTVSVAYRL